MDETTRYTDPPKPMTRTRLIKLVIAWSIPLVLLAIWVVPLLQGPTGRQPF